MAGAGTRIAQTPSISDCLVQTGVAALMPPTVRLAALVDKYELRMNTMNATFRTMRHSILNIGLLAFLATGCGLAASAPTAIPETATVAPTETAVAATASPP